MPSSADYANRIQDETRRAFEPRISALQVAFESLRNHLLTSIDQLAPKLDAIQSLELPEVERVVSEAMKEAAWQNQVEVNLLAEFASGMRRKETQEEILTLLLDTSHQFAHGVALFVVRGDEIAGWSSRGFSPDTAARFGSSSFSIADSALLRKALGSDGVLGVSHPPEEVRLQEMFQDEPLGSWHLLPMKALQRPIAVLIACDSQERRCNLDSLRIIMDFTSLCVENLALKILQEMRTAEPTTAEAAAAPAASEEVPEPPIVEPEPVPIMSQPPPLPIEAPIPAEPAAPAEIEEELKEIPFFAEPSPLVTAPPEPAPLIQEPEVPAQTFASSAPPPVAVRVTGLADVVPSVMGSVETAVISGPVEPPAIPVPAAPPVILEPAAPPVISAPVAPQMSPEEEKLRADARRFARLLVSEIKLYNEQRLLEARAGGKIYLRLKRDIDRSREMYEKRFPTSASRKADYFHDEIVRILAENDSAKLGGEYPGPRVES